MTTGPNRALLVLACLASMPRSASAHEVLHRVEPGRAVAVRVEYAGGEPLAYAEYRLFSPADRSIEHQKGRTDRNGYLSFVPEPPGRWHLQVVGRDAHGLDVDVDVDVARAASAPPPAPTPRPGLRAVAGVGSVALLFGLLFAFYRRREKRP